MVVVVRPGRRRPLQRVSAGCSPLLQVVEPKGQGGTVFQGGGRVDEGVGQELAGLLQVMAMLNCVGQDARQQAHILALRLNITRSEQGKMSEDERDNALLGLALPLADHSCGRTQNSFSTKNQ